MDVLPYELLIKIAVELKYSDLVNFCLTCSHIKSLYYDSYFWKRVSHHNFDIITDNRNKYIELYCNMNLYYPPGAEAIIDVDDCIFTAALNGQRANVDYFLNKGGSKNSAFSAAIASNDVNLMTYLMSAGMARTAFIIALELENYPMIEHLLPSVADVDDIIVLHGTLNSINFLRSRMYINKYKLLDCGVEMGNIEFIKRILKEEFDYVPTPGQEYEFIRKVGVSHTHLLPPLYPELFTSLSTITEIEKSLKLLIGQGQLDLIQKVISSHKNVNIVTLIATAAECNQLEILKYLLTLEQFNLNDVTQIGVRRGYIDMVRYGFDHGADNVEIVYMWATFRRDYEIMKYIMRKKLN